MVLENRPLAIGCPELVPALSAGVYRAEAALPFAGVWELHLVVERGGDTYRLRRRVYLEP